jgi:hypothetical protein
MNIGVDVSEYLASAYSGLEESINDKDNIPVYTALYSKRFESASAFLF